MAKRDTEKPVDLPPSQTWTPEQALAAAQKIPFAEVAIIGFTADGQIIIRHSRTDAAHLNWLGDALKDYALGGEANSDGNGR